MITIDGTSGTGTTSVALELAKRLKWGVFSAGNHLRAFATIAIREGLITDGRPDHYGMIKVLGKLRNKEIRLVSNGHGGFVLDGKDITSELHTEAATLAVQIVAAVPEVRAWHDQVMRDYAKAWQGKVAFDGRLTWGVFPEAELHVQLVADPAVCDARVGAARGSEVAALSRERANRDEKRATAPVRPAADAMIIDTTYITADQAVEMILAAVPSLAVAAIT